VTAGYWRIGGGLWIAGVDRSSVNTFCRQHTVRHRSVKRRQVASAAVNQRIIAEFYHGAWTVSRADRQISFGEQRSSG
jgi:hypothetical protein